MKTKALVIMLILISTSIMSIIANPLTPKDVAYLLKEQKAKNLSQSEIEKFNPLLRETGKAVFVQRSLAWNAQHRKDLLIIMYALDTPGSFEICSFARFDSEDKVADIAWEIFEGERYEEKNPRKQVATELLAAKQYPVEVASSLWGYKSQLTLSELAELFGAAMVKSNAEVTYFAPEAFKLAVKTARNSNARKGVLALLESTMTIGNADINAQTAKAIKKIKK